MQFLHKNLKILCQKQWQRRRFFASASHPTSQEIRRQFLDYFTGEHEHAFVRSSPVMPFCDPTVAFVNAGMNQFKNVFLGTSAARFRRVANTQKCVRVGGKHNDLSAVGADGYHHTFFEMMGNWSFGDYFKRDACAMAWNLLTERYGIDARRLYVTYFAGDERLGLDADLECREIWRSLGVSDERILPFGPRENFWEMGATGPCGPCTEIHYDHLPSFASCDVRTRATAVNADTADLTEIWNLVFIQYNRTANNTITELPQKHVDTGMGLERLVAILQGKSSNYGTDLFVPIFKEIQKVAQVPHYIDTYNLTSEHHQLNTAYRILADHSRMITACLADGMFPEQNHKLRRVIRKALSLAERTFGTPDLLHSTIPTVVRTLGPTYPEMQHSLPQIQQILRHEHETYRALLADAATDLRDILAANPLLEEQDVVEAAGFVPAYRELKELRSACAAAQREILPEMPGDVMFKLYDTYGLRDEAIERLGQAERWRLDWTGFEECKQRARERTKNAFSATTAEAGNRGNAIALNRNLPDTENELRYNYRFNFATREYYSPRVRVQVQAVHCVDADALLYDIVFDQSTFYPEGGGQDSDIGRLAKEKNKAASSGARVEHVRSERDGRIVVHRIRMPELDWLDVGDMVELIVDGKRRTACTLNHTATHLLNACVRRVTDSVCYQKSSSVTAQNLKLELVVLGCKIDAEVVRQVQDMIASIISTGVPVTIAQIDSHEFYTTDSITRIPGEIYPDRNVRILSMEHPQHGGIISREPCCGTHAINTRELEHFCVTHVRHTGRGAYALQAVAGKTAMASIELGESVRRDIDVLQSDACSEATRERILKRLRLLTGGAANAEAASDRVVVELPYLMRVECQRILADVSKAKRESTKDAMRTFVETEMRSALPHLERKAFIVHALPAIASTEPMPLQRANKLCGAMRPSIVSCRNTIDGSVRARCAVSKEAISENFGAASWLQVFASAFRGELAEPQKGQSAHEVAVMKARKVSDTDYDEMLAEAVVRAEAFADKYFVVEEKASGSID